jgi:hypothetical protein
MGKGNHTRCGGVGEWAAGLKERMRVGEEVEGGERPPTDLHGL